MKEFNKEEYNKLCATFLGWEFVDRDSFVGIKKPISSYYVDDKGKEHCVEYMEFDSDWNWIMKVVDKIEMAFPEQRLRWNCVDDGNVMKYTAFWFTPRIEDELGFSGYFAYTTKQEAVAMAIWELLCWCYESEETK